MSEFGEGGIEFHAKQSGGGGLNNGMTVVATLSAGTNASSSSTLSWGDISFADNGFDEFPQAYTAVGELTDLPSWVDYNFDDQTFQITQAGLYILEGSVSSTITPGSSALRVSISLAGDQTGLPQIGILPGRSDQWGTNQLALVANNNTPSPLGLSISIFGTNFGSATITPIFSVTKIG